MSHYEGEQVCVFGSIGAPGDFLTFSKSVRGVVPMTGPEDASRTNQVH